MSQARTFYPLGPYCVDLFIVFAPLDSGAFRVFFETTDPGTLDFPATRLTLRSGSIGKLVVKQYKIDSKDLCSCDFEILDLGDSDVSEETKAKWTLPPKGICIGLPGTDCAGFHGECKLGQVLENDGTACLCVDGEGDT